MVEGAWNPAGKSCAAGGGPAAFRRWRPHCPAAPDPGASHQDVRAGIALSAALEERQAVTSIGSSLVRVGEASGQLAEMLQSLATLYGEAGQARMKRPWY